VRFMQIQWARMLQKRGRRRVTQSACPHAKVFLLANLLKHHVGKPGIENPARHSFSISDDGWSPNKGVGSEE